MQTTPQPVAGGIGRVYLPVTVPTGTPNGVYTLWADVWDYTPDGYLRSMSVPSRTSVIVAVPQPQAITFDPLADKTYGDSDFTVSASASSGLPVYFTATGDCSVLGSTRTCSRWMQMKHFLFHQGLLM